MVLRIVFFVKGNGTDKMISGSVIYQSARQEIRQLYFRVYDFGECVCL